MKLASKTAFEMVIRNEAYSNLIELLFPFHIRLSIHGDENSGQMFKFGISLFARGGQQGGSGPKRRDIQVWPCPELLSKGATPATENIKGQENTKNKEPNPPNRALHVPTPWHNCIAKLTDSTGQARQAGERKNQEPPTRWVVAEAKIIKAALAKGSYSGSWVERGRADQDGESLGGGYFCLKRVESVREVEE